MKIRTIAAIILWIAVVLLLLNRIFNSDLVLPIAIILTLVAILLYFSNRILKNPQTK